MRIYRNAFLVSLGLTALMVFAATMVIVAAYLIPSLALSDGEEHYLRMGNLLFGLACGVFFSWYPALVANMKWVARKKAFNRK